MRQRMRKKTDRKIFRRTADRTKKMNISVAGIPRGGVRL